MSDTTAEQPPKCSHPDCNLETYQNDDKCVLHCEKSEKPAWGKNAIELFSIALDNYIQERKGTEDYIMLQDLIFPQEDIEYSFSSMKQENHRESKSFYNILETVRYIEFHNCTFYTGAIHMGGIFYFKNCHFFGQCTIELRGDEYHLRFLDGLLIKPIYDECHFRSKVIVIGENKFGTSNTLFYSSCFEDELIFIQNEGEQAKLDFTPFRNIKCPHITFYNIKFIKKDLKNLKDCKRFLSFNKCIFSNKIEIPEATIKKLQVDSCIFQNDLIMPNTQIETSLVINNTIFEQAINLSGSKLTNATIAHSSFKGSVNFQQCTFNIIKDNTEQFAYKTESNEVFKYTVFKGYLDLRSTNFLSGLNLQTIEYIIQPNFLGTTISSKNTNRETYRIIKHSFDSVGNHIEGSKYFAEEMRVYRNELFKETFFFSEGYQNKLWKRMESFSKLFILFLNKISSNFGQNWILPILWLFCFMYGRDYLYDKYMNEQFVTSNQYIHKLNTIVFKTINQITPIKLYCSDIGFSLTALFFYFVYAVFIYQLVIALKRLTRR